MITKQEFVNTILSQSFSEENVNIKNETGFYFAPINIALIKYWGKENEELKTPMSSSLSMTIPEFGTKTKIIKSPKDEVLFNGKDIDKDDDFFKKIFNYFNLFRNYFNDKNCYKIITENNISTASGLASSASGFGALLFAINDLYNIQLSQKNLSLLARIGSGSACRSVFGTDEKNRFVIWNKETKNINDEKYGFNSYAEPIYCLPDFVNKIKIRIVEISKEKKQISSTDAMRKTIEFAQQNKNAIYNKWLEQTQKDIVNIFNTKDFIEFGEIVENNALMMHKSMQEVGINYFLPKTEQVIQEIQQNRKKGKMEFITIDAGANVKVLYLDNTRK